MTATTATRPAAPDQGSPAGQGQRSDPRGGVHSQSELADQLDASRPVRHPGHAVARSRRARRVQGPRQPTGWSTRCPASAPSNGAAALRRRRRPAAGTPAGRVARLGRSRGQHGRAAHPAGRSASARVRTSTAPNCPRSPARSPATTPCCWSAVPAADGHARSGEPSPPHSPARLLATAQRTG